jgi:hypothetical protein
MEVTTQIPGKNSRGAGVTATDLPLVAKMPPYVLTHPSRIYTPLTGLLVARPAPAVPMEMHASCAA